MSTFQEHEKVIKKKKKTILINGGLYRDIPKIKILK